MLFHQTSNSLGNYNYNAFIYKGTEYPLHFHGNYELIYTMNGITEISINGTVSNLEAGHFILVSPYTTHSIKVPDDSLSWVGVFSKDYIPDFAQKYQFMHFSEFKCDTEFKKFLSDNLLKAKKPDHYLLEACLYLVCGQCLKNAEPKTAKKVNNAFIGDVIVYISENIDKNITMEDVANKLNYEYHYFSALFHDCFSMNFKKFINIFRFEQACEMLSKKECNITVVCNECGFSSIRNFNRIFKDLSGMTPSQYKSSFSAK